MRTEAEIRAKLARWYELREKVFERLVACTEALRAVEARQQDYLARYEAAKVTLQEQSGLQADTQVLTQRIKLQQMQDAEIDQIAKETEAAMSLHRINLPELGRDLDVNNAFNLIRGTIEALEWTLSVIQQFEYN